ncbi:hypothetical protein J2S30_002554 [Herbaspirillum rubrisubalbicans]|uniref:hypothetical protein n=1 Tax=Herbaspirillum rubrisubalbicans TaxID=80842 RepID=UPI0020A06F9C|nr:hypothetical protein [Herbaspirillum rubrisubalbicans]MCP1574175.1 hypothetical protein [Herbaspirillum rubrisubalbicans]
MPSEFLAKNFTVTTNVPFGTLGKLQPKPTISIAQIVTASFECGYGRNRYFSSRLALSKTEAKAFERYLHIRRRMALSCLTYDKTNSAWVVNNFYKQIEPSEKAAISFIVGSIFTFIAAKKWLYAGNTPMIDCLHAALYKNALVKFFPDDKKSPDYLISARGKTWHVFESKGGDSRYAKIVEGLVQLKDVKSVGWATQTTTSAPVTTVCVHTMVKAGTPLDVYAVDPPGDEDYPTDSEDGDSSDTYFLSRSLCKVFKALEVINQFQALLPQKFDGQNPLGDEWEIAISRELKGSLIAIPKQYLEYENEIRASVGTYLFFMEGIKLHGLRFFLRSEIQSELNQAFIDSGIGICPLPAFVRQLHITTLRDDWVVYTPSELSKKLGIPSLARILTLQSSSLVAAQLRTNNLESMTTGGLYIANAYENLANLLAVDDE